MRLAVVGAVLAGLVPAVTYAQTTGGVTLRGPDVPAALQVPDGQVFLFRAYAAGTQSYECQTNSDGTTTWLFGV